MRNRRPLKKDYVEITFVDWCRQSNYSDIADFVERLRTQWAAEGNGTRRNWWDLFAGTKDGKQRIVRGIEIPILQAARKRKSWPIVEGALCRNPEEQIPGISLQTRWDHKRTMKMPISQSSGVVRPVSPLPGPDTPIH